MNGKEFIDLAGRLVASGSTSDSAARCRSAISRSYYGAFHCAAAVLEELGKPPLKNAQGHRETINTLLRSKIAAACEAGGFIDDLHTSRIRADYRLEDTRSENIQNAKLSVEDASNALSALNKCLEEPVRSKLIAALAKLP